ncbi:MAG: C/D box methylation guide ribonucleoprotein complex aNOP56 subunit [Candidatus Thorarchaeota archaeon]
MQVFGTFTTFGVFLLNSESKILHEVITYPNLEESVQNTRHLNIGTATDQLRELLGNLTEDTTIVTAHPELRDAISGISSNVLVEFRNNEPVIKWFLNIHDSLLIDRSIVKSNEELHDFRRQVGLALARFTVSEASEEKDQSLKHAIDGVEEVDKSTNVIAMRLREWYSLHFPMLNDIIEDNEQFASVVSICGDRKNLTKENLSRTIAPESIQEKILNSADTLGASMAPTDLDIIQSLSTSVLNLYKQRRDLEEYVTKVMGKIAPNITSLVGPLVGARLISLAGSLKELARKPSSTLQILGAEKALFRSLKTGADPPKHGVIYQVSDIHSAPYWQRGKIARALSGKLSIAARIDAYADSPSPTGLREQFESRLAEIQRQNPEAPPPKPPKPVQKIERPRHRPSRGPPSKKKRGGGRR